MLRFNTSKTGWNYVISARINMQLAKLNLSLVLHIKESDIITEEAVTYLGVIVDKFLKRDTHINEIFIVCIYHLIRNISKIRRYLTTEA